MVRSHFTVPSRDRRRSHANLTTRFGLRLDNDCVGLAIATTTEGGETELAFDQVQAAGNEAFLTGGDPRPLTEALEMLAERHGLRRQRVAVSLDGDFCVTRVTVSSPRRMQRSLSLLSERVDHYLQLGPGKKVTGVAHINLDERTQYAATAVISLPLIEFLYDAFLGARLNVAWVEPSLISLSRLIGKDVRYADQTVLIADGTGHRWDIGVAGSGRLWLDYRPAGAETFAGVHRAIDGHLERLQRFCRRHRKIESATMAELLICGSPSKASEAIRSLEGFNGLRAVRFDMPDTRSLFNTNAPSTNPSEPRASSKDQTSQDQMSQTQASQGQVSPNHGDLSMDSQSISPQHIPALASVLPLIIDTPPEQIPDMLSHIRREPPRTTTQIVFACLLPMMATAALLIVSVSYRRFQQRRLATVSAEVETLQTQLATNQDRNRQLIARSEEIANLQHLASLAHIDGPMRLFTQVTQCLPPTTRMLSWSMQGNHHVRLIGETQDESSVYEIRQSIAKIVEVHDVNIVSTEPSTDERGGRFVLNLAVRDKHGHQGNFGEGAIGGDEDALDSSIDVDALDEFDETALMAPMGHNPDRRHTAKFPRHRSVHRVANNSSTSKSVASKCRVFESATSSSMKDSAPTGGRRG